MIYVFRGLYDRVLDFTGGWWFDTQQPLDLDPVSAIISESADDSADDENVVHSKRRPKCRTCGDPNYSLESEICIACRALI